MESIEQMIKRLCPKGVEYVKLGEVCDVLRGKRLTKKELFDDAQYKVFHGGLSPIGYYTKANRQAQTVMVINVGASAGTVGFCEEDFWSSDGCFCLSHNDSVIRPKYLYYYLAKHQISIQSRVRKAGIPTLDAGAVMDILIPLPPLEIQSRIVEVLDKMTTLTSELEAELKAELETRKQQYEYYRNKLLTFSEIGEGNRQVTWKKISEIGTIYRGIAYSKKDFTDTGTPCIHYGQIYTRYGTFANKTFTCVSKDLAKGKRLAKKGDLVMAVTSENMEDVGKCLAWLGEDEILVSNHACFIRHSLNPKYLAYFLQTSYFFNYKKKISKGVKVIDLDLNMFGDMLIPVPPLEIQSRIVEVLDKMTTLTAELEAELEARKQQYEYYRDKLLIFNEIGGVIGK